MLVPSVMVELGSVGLSSALLVFHHFSCMLVSFCTALILFILNCPPNSVFILLRMLWVSELIASPKVFL